jgi:integrase
LRVYAEHRDAYLAGLPMRSPPVRFFVTTRGMPCARNFVSVPFRRISRQIGLRAADARKGPRIHDLRHGFAVGTLLKWYRSGKKIDPLMPVLSTYLGHGCVAATYWYITCTPELMQSVGKRLEERWKGTPDADLH